MSEGIGQIETNYKANQNNENKELFEKINKMVLSLPRFIVDNLKLK